MGPGSSSGEAPGAGGWAGSCHGRLWWSWAGVGPLVGGAGSQGLWLQGLGILGLVPLLLCVGQGPGPSGGQGCAVFQVAVGSGGLKVACLLVVSGALFPPKLVAWPEASQY